MNDFYLDVELVHPNAKMPTRSHSTDAGLDIYSTTNFIIPHNLDVLHSIGIKVKFPAGYCLQIVDKSGRSTKDKLIVGAGLIDSDYRGLVMVHLFNFGRKVKYIEAGEKIAQIVVHKIWTGVPKQVEHIKEDTKRGTGGFGSTGLKE
jgi:dUTP pyrophosphatase